MMTKLKLVLICLAVGLAASCATVKKQSITKNNMSRFSYFKIEALKRSDVTVLKTLKASSSVTIDKMGKVTGNTNNYGYFREPQTTSRRRTGGLFGTAARTNVFVPTDPETIARRNAIFKVIQQANAEGADVLWMPRFTVTVKDLDEGSKMITVTVFTKALQLKAG